MPRMIDTSRVHNNSGRIRILPKGMITIEGESTPVEEKGPEDVGVKSLQYTPPPPPKTILDALPPGVLRALDPTKIVQRWELMQQLHDTIPLTQHDLPRFVYRADLIAPNIFEPIKWAPEDITSDHVKTMLDTLESAQVKLDYSEGFPTLPNGLPFWSRLPYEPDDAYITFTHYLELPGARHIHNLTAWDLDETRDYLHSYYWVFRARAYDIYKVVYHQKQKISRLMSTENSHYMMAEKMLAKITPVLDAVEWKDQYPGDPAALVAIVEKLVKIQRLSLGMSLSGKDSEKPLAVPRTETIMQQIADQNPKLATEEEDANLSMLYQNPDAIDLAQQLVISMQHNAPGHAINESEIASDDPLAPQYPVKP